MEHVVKIAPADIPAAAYSTGCRVLSGSVPLFYEKEGNRRAYKKWLKTPEGQRADLTKESRKASKEARYAAR